MSWESDRGRKEGVRGGGGKNMFPASDSGAEIEEVTRVRGRERDRFANYLLLRRFARIRACYDVSEPRQGAARFSRVIFHSAVDDNAIRDSGRQCHEEFSFASLGIPQ